jgi:3-oxoacyl-(acyl-carrier-protein) synthase
MHTVRLTGLGLCIEDAQRPLWRDLHAAFEARPGASWLRSKEHADASELVPSKERRILSWDDVLGICTADLACRDANPEWADDAACIVVNTGKHTVDGERETYRRQFMKPDATLDGLAMAQAVERGEAQINPFSLLRTLDNNVLWWLCRYRNFGAVNLQLTQRTTPSFFALWEAVELVREGSATQVLVGGTQMIAQASVDRTQESQRFVRAADDAVGGGAIFFVLESEQSARARGREGYAELSLEAPQRAHVETLVRDQEVGVAGGGRAPGLASLLGLLEAILQERAIHLAGAHADAALISVRPTGAL